MRLSATASIALFFLRFLFPLFIGVCGLFGRAIENAIEKRLVNRIIAF